MQMDSVEEVVEEEVEVELLVDEELELDVEVDEELELEEELDEEVEVEVDDVVEVEVELEVSPVVSSRMPWVSLGGAAVVSSCVASSGQAVV